VPWLLTHPWLAYTPLPRLLTDDPVCLLIHYSDAYWCSLSLLTDPLSLTKTAQSYAW
jgi:hypothetical protein